MPRGHIRAQWLLAVAMLLAWPAASSRAADESWNPFRDRDQQRAERRTKPPAADTQPPLAPMQGPAGGTEPSTAAPTAPDLAAVATPGQSAGTPTRPPADGPIAADRPSRGAGLDERSRGVERSELPPLQITDGAELPGDFWQGVDARAVEGHLVKLATTLSSPALVGIWRRVMTAPSAPAGADPREFEAFRLDRLMRMGQVDDAAAVIERTGGKSAGSPVQTVFVAKTLLALGLVERGCGAQAELTRQRASMAPPLRAESLLLGGLCAALAGDHPAAGLAVELAREDGVRASLHLAALEAFAFASRVPIELPKVVTLADYRFLEVAGPTDPVRLVERADPALAVALARDGRIAAADVRATAAERAARALALPLEELVARYRDAARSSGSGAPAGAEPSGAKAPPGPGSAPAPVDTEGAVRRAQLQVAAEAERTPLKRARAIRSLLDSARRAGLYAVALKMVAPFIEEMHRDRQITAEIGWFVETAVEVALAAERFDTARGIIDGAAPFDRAAGGVGIGHWRALVEIADPRTSGRRGATLPAIEDLALRSRLSADELNRLATVLDALDYDVPIALWDAANRAPPLTKGFLPETGILAELLDASKKRQIGRTMLLVLRTLDRDGPTGAQLIGLGDSIRALRRVGLEAEARRIAVEALLAGWPRAS